jgi:sulfonate transport system substrate-binding protein
MRVMRMLAAAFAMALSLVGAAAVQAEPVQIKIGYVIPVANWPSFVFTDTKLLPHYGKSYVVEAMQYRSTPAMVNALSVGELNFADLAYSSVAFAIENAGMKDLRVIADEVQDGKDGYYSGEFYVAKDSGIAKVEDLKGKVLATASTGSAVDIAARMMLRKHGLEDRRDYSVIESPWPTMRAMLAEKKVAFVPTTLPFSTDPWWRENGKLLFTQKDAMGKSQLIVLTGRKEFIDKNRAALVDFFQDVIGALAHYADPKNRSEMLAIAAKLTRQPEKTFEGWLFTHQDYYRSPDLVPDLDGLQAAVDAQKEVGFLKERIDIKAYADLSLVQEAAKRGK